MTYNGRIITLITEIWKTIITPIIIKMMIIEKTTVIMITMITKTNNKNNIDNNDNNYCHNNNNVNNINDNSNSNGNMVRRQQ